MERKYRVNNSLIINRLFMACFFILLVGCVGTTGHLPGQLSTSKSKFDNSIGLELAPSWLNTDSGAPFIKFGLYKNSKMPKDEMILTAVVKGAYNFERGESLKFNIDGKILGLESIDEMTDIETHSGYYPSNWSSKRYRINQNLLETLLSAKLVVVKIDFTKTYAEGMFTGSQAHKAFKIFYDKIK